MRTALILLAVLSTGVAAYAQPAPSPSPVILSSASPTASPIASPAATPTILMLAPDAAPQILWTSISTTMPSVGDTLTGVVLTSSNVASVELRVSGYGMTANKTDVGHFEWSFVVPKLPPFFNHTFPIEILARNTAGAQAHDSITISVR